MPPLASPYSPSSRGIQLPRLKLCAHTRARLLQSYGNSCMQMRTIPAVFQYKYTQLQQQQQQQHEITTVTPTHNTQHTHRCTHSCTLVVHAAVHAIKITLVKIFILCSTHTVASHTHARTHTRKTIIKMSCEKKRKR